MWNILYGGLLFAVLFFIFYPQYLLVVFFQALKLGIVVMQVVYSCTARVKLWKRKATREFAVRTKTFDERPIMAKPSLHIPHKKKF